MAKLIIIIAVLMATAATETSASQADILQCAQDRLYFSVGEEQLVFPGCAFTLYEDSTPVYNGIIAFSDLGISYSEPTERFFDSLLIDRYRAEINAAETDTISSVVIGAFGVRDDILTDTTSRIRLRRYDALLEMQYDFEKGLLDGYLAYEQSSLASVDAYRLSAPAPYYAAMIPGLSRQAEDNGMLTTSLYYRIDESKYSLLFSGDEVQPFNCLYPLTADCRRPYSFDTDKGKQLIRNIRGHMHQATINSEDRPLLRTAVYFTDILSRDRVQMDRVEADARASVYLTWVPIEDTRPQACLRAVNDFLVRITDGENQRVDLIGTYLELGDSSDQDTISHRYYRTAEKSMIEDIGVFPLFRPTIHLVARSCIRGLTFDSSGKLNPAGLIRVIMPDYEAGDQR